MPQSGVAVPRRDRADRWDAWGDGLWHEPDRARSRRGRSRFAAAPEDLDRNDSFIRSGIYDIEHAAAPRRSEWLSDEPAVASGRSDWLSDDPTVASDRSDWLADEPAVAARSGAASDLDVPESWLAERTALQNGEPAPRRTVTIRGHGDERYIPPALGMTSRRRSSPRHERPGFRGDRTAMWAVLLCLLVLLAAVASAHGATLHTLH